MWVECLIATGLSGQSIELRLCHVIHKKRLADARLTPIKISRKSATPLEHGTRTDPIRVIRFRCRFRCLTSLLQRSQKWRHPIKFPARNLLVSVLLALNTAAAQETPQALAAQFAAADKIGDHDAAMALFNTKNPLAVKGAYINNLYGCAEDRPSTINAAALSDEDIGAFAEHNVDSVPSPDARSMSRANPIIASRLKVSNRSTTPRLTVATS